MVAAMDMVSELPEPQVLTGGMVLATALIALAPSWRLGLLALLLQYVAVGALLSREIAPVAGGVQLLTGALGCLILYPTLRRMDFPADSPVGVWLQVSRAGFRLAALALIGLGAFGTAAWQRWPDFPVALSTAALWLMGSGLLIPLLRPTRLWVGFGSLTFVTGFAILRNVWQSDGWRDAALWSGASLLLALAVALALRFPFFPAIRGDEPRPGTKRPRQR